ncbi:5-oxoprolinase/urea amidolyase family protein [Phyllobacterium leguminum]|uniref:KipI family sensor histidine kinase inhibitor n=1 Tax=Phyllobacterium leguminum TaxID=314237 RepID=A0A318T5H2_9HYPH|nr:5-oxoprolinase/urea amidolyase family protein [Phyllobacterium leguminum]PYE88076.1 KipI family sensor histidine kinase inhibitor [Phyllobacterium leguminum]
MQPPVPAQNTSINILPVRAGCILLELADLDATLGLLDALQANPIAGIREIVPGARTLLVEFDPGRIALAELKSAIASLSGTGRKVSDGPLVEIPVRYDGEDLADVAGLVGMSVTDVVRLHTQSEYLVAFTGFAPGFAYLAGGDPRLAVPRRKSPRTRVPAGAVGLAGEFSGVYPKAGPGGWQLIGTTHLAMFDIDRTPASLLQPGMRVRFRDMASSPVVESPHLLPAQGEKEETATLTPPSPRLRGEGKGEGQTPAIEVLSVALPALFQDLGRIGQARQGISTSGAADRGSLKRANRLAGNAPDTAALEITLGGFSFRMRGRGVMAVTGAPVITTIIDVAGKKITAPHDQAIALDDGDLVALQPPAAGLRSYLALRGGFDVRQILGSASTDTLAQIGPLPAMPGDIIPILAAPAGSIVSTEELPAFAMPCPGETVTLDVTMGPRTDWFLPEATQSFLKQEWLVTPQSSRVGIRLHGEALERSNHGELPSEATVHGAIQVPANGQPILFLADHPLTGGYPVIANVAEHHLDLAGQIPPGARIRFAAMSQFMSEVIPGKQR